MRTHFMSLKRLSLLALMGIPTIMTACGDGDQVIEEDTDDNNDDTDDGVPQETDIGGDTLADAATLERNADGFFEVDDAIGYDGDRDFFRVDLTSGETLMAYTTSQSGGEGYPDTVIRLYDTSGTMIAENDDTPFRLQGTDSCVYWQTVEAGEHYIEVLEYGDWIGSGASGSPSNEYNLVIFNRTELDQEPENNTIEDVTAWTDVKGNYVYYGHPMDAQGFLYEMIADMDSADDVDIYPMDFSEDSEGAYYLWNMWDSPMNDLEVEWTLYNGDGEIVAQTNDPAWGVDAQYYYDYGAFFYDTGIMFRVTPGEYYLAVSNVNGETGVGTFYPASVGGYIADFAQWEGSDYGETSYFGGATVEEWDDYSDGSGVYARVSGQLEGALPAAGDDEPKTKTDTDTTTDTDATTDTDTTTETEGGSEDDSGSASVKGEDEDDDGKAAPPLDDPLDSWAVVANDVDGLDGKYLSVILHGMSYGSLLDSKMTIYDEDGNVLETATTNSFDNGPDPAIENLEMGAHDKIYIVIEPESGSEHGKAHNYFVSVNVTLAPM